MSTLLWIVAGGLAMSAIALVGSVTLVLDERQLQRLVLPLVAFSAGSLLGGALFHMMPAFLRRTSNEAIAGFVWLVLGFTVFFALEQLLHWHHCHQVPCPHRTQPLSLLVLVADGLHNLIGGLAVGGAFVIDVRLGVTAWLVAAAHEVPQELGDFGVLVHGGLSRGRALLLNLASALTFLVGGVVAWAVGRSMDVSFLLPFAAGNFLYIAASDLVPEVNRSETLPKSLLHFVCFAAGLLLLYAVRALEAG
jgi:zinc and cadmium transporter